MTVALNKPMTEVSAKIDNLEQKLNSAEQSDTLIKSSLLSMQRQTLLHSCEDRIKAGYATISQKETISELYNSYHALGGDSFITDLVNQVKLLPLEKPVKVTRTKKTKTQLLVEGE